MKFFPTALAEATRLQETFLDRFDELAEKVVTTIETAEHCKLNVNENPFLREGILGNNQPIQVITWIEGENHSLTNDGPIYRMNGIIDIESGDLEIDITLSFLHMNGQGRLYLEISVFLGEYEVTLEDVKTASFAGALSTLLAKEALPVNGEVLK